jgi:opacity protein-like surface antigen
MLKWGMGVAGAALVTAFASGTANAQQAYISGGVGWTSLGNADTRVENGISPGVDMVYKVTTDENLSGRAAFGFDLGNLRVEGEIGMSQNDVSDYQSTSPPNVANRADGALSTLSAMANAYWDFDMGNGVSPYLGIGIGGMQAELSVAGPRPTAPTGPVVTLLDTEQTNIAWQAMAGFAVPVTSQLTATVGYRMFDAGSMDTNDPQGRATHIEIKGQSIDVGLRMTF